MVKFRYKRRDIVIHYGWVGFGSVTRWNNGNPYKSIYSGFIRVDIFRGYARY